MHGIGGFFSTYNHQELSVALVCPAACLAGEEVSGSVPQSAAQITRLVGLEFLLAELLNAVQDVLFVLESVEKKFNPRILTVLGQAQAVGGPSDVQLINQSGEECPDLLEVFLRHAAVHKEEDVCKPFGQG